MILYEDLINIHGIRSQRRVDKKYLLFLCLLLSTNQVHEEEIDETHGFIHLNS